MNHLVFKPPCRGQYCNTLPQVIEQSLFLFFREFLFPPLLFTKRRRRPLVAWNTVTLKKGGREKKKGHCWYVRFLLCRLVGKETGNKVKVCQFFYFLIKNFSNPILTPKKCLHIRVFKHKGSNTITEIFSCVLCNIWRLSISSCLEKNIFFKKIYFCELFFVKLSFVCVRARCLMSLHPSSSSSSRKCVSPQRGKEKRERETASSSSSFLLLFPPPPPPLSSLRRLREKAKGKLSQGVTAGGGVERRRISHLFWKK